MGFFNKALGNRYFVKGQGNKLMDKYNGIAY